MSPRVANPFKRLPLSAKAPLKALWSTGVSRLSQWRSPPDAAANAILLFGSPRSGTTWLMERIAAQPGICPVFEPLNPREDLRVAELLSDPWLRLEPHEPFDELRRYFDDVLSGQHLTRWSSAHASMRQLLNAERRIVKVIRANRAVGWFCRQYPTLPKIFLLRDPAAAVASMLRSPGIWQRWHKSYLLQPAYALLDRDTHERLASLKSRAGWLAVFWCCNTALALGETTPEELLVVAYEDLLQNPQAALTRLAPHLGIDDIAASLRDVNKPSRTAQRRAFSASDRPDELTEAERREIHQVLDAFGIDFYTAHGGFDGEKLRRYHSGP